MNQVRVQILLDSNQHQALKRAAKREHISYSELFRRMANNYLEKNEKEFEDEYRLILKDLRRIREEQPLYTGNPVAEARAEREMQQNSEKK